MEDIYCKGRNTPTKSVYVGVVLPTVKNSVLKEITKKLFVNLWPG